MTTAAATTAAATTAATTAKPTSSAPAVVSPPRDVSIAIVKASQREHVLSRLWPEFVKSHRLKHADPTKASTAALSLFVCRLLEGEVRNGGGGGGGEGEGEGRGSNTVTAAAAAAAAAAAEAASRLARRHLGVAEQLAAERKAEKAATAAAAAATAKAASKAEEAPTDAGTSSSSPSSLLAGVRSLVAATLAHPRSKELYGSFPVTSKGWKRLPRVYGNGAAAAAAAAAAAEAPSASASAASASAAAAGPPASPPSSPPPLPPALVAIDCEMVETEGGKKTDLARVAIAASIPRCWFEEEGEEEEEGDGGSGRNDDGDDGSNSGDKKNEGEEKEEGEAANGNEAPSPPPPPTLFLSPLEAAALSLKKVGYGPPHLVLSVAVAPPASRRVSDWRSHVTGLSRCSLSAAPMTRAEAQMAVVAAVARASGWAAEEEKKGRDSLSPSPEPEPEPEPPAAAAAAESLSAPAPPPRPLPAPAVLVGHALHHDLRALRLDAASGTLVIDTSLLYGYEGLPRATPGLADLYSAVVCKRGSEGSSAVAVAPLRSPGAPHDCAADAVAALALAAEALASRVSSFKGAPTTTTTAAAATSQNQTPQRITVPAPARKVERDELCKLLVHGLKPPSPSLSRSFDAAAAVAALFETMPAGVARPKSVEAVAAAAAAPGAEKEAATKPANNANAATAVATKAWAVFATPAEADAAFAALPLPTPGSPSSASVATDSLGRPQRLARLPYAAAAAAGGNRSREHPKNAASSSSSLLFSSSSPLVSPSSQIVRVRKAAAHAGMSHGRFKPAKRDRSVASVRHGREKKMRRKSG